MALGVTLAEQRFYFRLEVEVLAMMLDHGDVGVLQDLVRSGRGQAILLGYLLHSSVAALCLQTQRARIFPTIARIFSIFRLTS